MSKIQSFLIIKLNLFVNLFR